jgi:hypothetical protein
MKTIDPKETENEQTTPGTFAPERAATEQEDYPENGNESITEGETDSSDLETEPLYDEEDDL